MALSAAGLPPLDDGAAVRSGASELESAVDRVAARAQSIQATWSAIAPHYDAPEAALVHTAMDQPVTSATTLATKTGTAAGALSSYGDRLEELNAQRSQLVADIGSFNAHRAEVSSETNGFLGWKEWTGWEKQDLLNKEEDLNDRCAAFAAAVDEAQRTCANAINAIFGGAQYTSADRASVGDADVYGLSQDGYDQLGLSGQNAWGAPAGWTDTSWMSAGFMVGRGAVRSVTGLVDLGSALTGIGAEDGETAAAWSGLWQLTQDAAKYSSPAVMMAGFSSDAQGMQESGDRLLGVGKSILGIGTWQTSGWNTAGGFVPDIALALVTAGGGAAVKAGATGAAKGALAGALTRLAPSAAANIGDLNTALRAGMRARYGTALTGIRDLGYRGIDGLADLRRATSEVPGTTRQWVDDLGRQLGPEPVPAGGPRIVPAAPRVWDETGTVQRSTAGGAETGWPTHRPSGGSTPSSPAAGSPAAGSSYAGSSYAGDTATGMRGAPAHTNATARVNVGDDLMPRAREPFGQRDDLAPFTRYEVRGRGVFYTNADGIVEYVEPMRKSIGVREFMSSDLRHPLPNVTYKVDDYAYFHTDDLGRTDHVHVENLELRPETRSSGAANRGVVGGTPDTDAGHLLARGLGGAREEINLVQMVRDLNRGWGGRSLEAQSSVRHIEIELEKALRQAGPGQHVAFDLKIAYDRRGALRFDYAPTQGGAPIPGATTSIFNR